MFGGVEPHCQPGFGFQFAIDSGRLLRRRGIDDLHMVTASIANSDDPFIIFFGAGFAHSSRLPMGNALRDGAIRRLLAIPPETLLTSQELANRFQRWISTRPTWLSETERRMRSDQYVAQLTLEQVMRAEQNVYPDLPTLKEFRARHDEVVGSPGSAALDLAAVLEKARGRVILVEVNFDQLVETHASVPLKVFSSDEEFAGAAEYLRGYFAGQQEAIPLLKLHGTIERPDTCIVSAEQTELGVSAGKLEAIRALLDSVDPRLWIYVGVSMRDQDLLQVFHGAEFANGVEERWVSPFLPDTVEAYGRKQEPFWRKRPLTTVEDRLISETADAFFAAMRTAWSARIE